MGITTREFFEAFTLRREYIDRFLDPNAHNYAVFDSELGYIRKNSVLKDGIDESYTTSVTASTCMKPSKTALMFGSASPNCAQSTLILRYWEQWRMRWRCRWTSVRRQPLPILPKPTANLRATVKHVYSGQSAEVCKGCRKRIDGSFKLSVK